MSQQDPQEPQAPAPPDTYWTDISIPFQDEQEDLQFVNPVVVAQQFVRVANLCSVLGQQAEMTTDLLARLEAERSEDERSLARLRRDVLAANINGIAKSASGEMLDAFILASATAEQAAMMADLEKKIEERTKRINRGKPRLEREKARLKAAERNMDWGRQFLDYEKLLARINAGGRF